MLTNDNKSLHIVSRTFNATGTKTYFSRCAWWPKKVSAQVYTESAAMELVRTTQENYPDGYLFLVEPV